MFRTGVLNPRSDGQIQPAEVFQPARDNFIKIKSL